MPRGALNTAGPKNQDPRPYAQTARDKDGVPTTASQVLCRRSRGPRSKAQETRYPVLIARRLRVWAGFWSFGPAVFNAPRGMWISLLSFRLQDFGLAVLYKTK
jgi:hypothetical protein